MHMSAVAVKDAYVLTKLHGKVSMDMPSSRMYVDIISCSHICVRDCIYVCVQAV